MCYSNPNQILVFHPLNDASNTNRVKQRLESNRKKGRKKNKELKKITQCFHACDEDQNDHPLQFNTVLA